MNLRHTAPRPHTAALAEVLRYGGLGLPLAFAALPLVVQWPAYAASQWGLSLAGLGALLLGVRVADAVVDPWIGRRADSWFAHSASRPWWALVLAAALLLAGFATLFGAPKSFLSSVGVNSIWVWCGFALLITYLGYSLGQVVHQAWGARMGGDAVQRARWVASREGFALVGVLAASILPTVAGWAFTGLVLALALAVALTSLRGLPTGNNAARSHGHQDSPRQVGPVEPASPWSFAPFRSLLLVYTFNGLAAAIPASLVLFFVRDRLQAGPEFEAASLGIYFGAAALGVPLWVRAIRRLGLAQAWAAGMLLAIASFAGAAAVGAGQAGLFLAICAASGLALGADLVAPAALLAGVIQSAGAAGQAEGRWFGWWSMATKLTLALAAGVALPLVQALGYTPGATDPSAMWALAGVYAVLPCVLKAMALLALLRWRGRWADKRSDSGTLATAALAGAAAPAAGADASVPPAGQARPAASRVTPL